MDLGLTSRRAFVAGSSSGIGAGIAIGLAREGCEVIVHGRQQARADDVVRQIREAGGKASTIIGGLDEMALVDDLAARALATGPIDILINSAGACQDVRDWLDVPMENWFHQYKISLVYSVQLIRAFVPAMQQRGWGRVLNVSSTTAYSPMVRHPEYSAAKIANLSVSASLAKALGNSGVTVNTLVSGLVMTEHTQRAAEVSGSRSDSIRRLLTSWNACCARPGVRTSRSAAARLWTRWRQRPASSCRRRRALSPAHRSGSMAAARASHSDEAQGWHRTQVIASDRPWSQNLNCAGSL